MADTAYFTPELFEFLRQLKRHNKREWFTRNKTRYEEVVRNPALLFIAAATAPLSKLIKPGAPLLRASLFRIYRDIRFSSDKRPYKTHVGIQFTYSTAKDAHASGYYLHLEPDSCFAAAGVWHPDAATLIRIRSAIVASPEQWKKVRRKIDLGGDKLQRPPRGFDPAHPFIEDLKFKDFVASEDFSESQVCRPQFIRDFVDACRNMTPIVQFTGRAMGLKL